MSTARGRGRRDKLLELVVRGPHLAVVYLFWVILWGGCFLSAWLVYRWGYYLWTNLILSNPHEFEVLLHNFLHGIELLLLVPLPGIVATVVYQSLGIFTNPAAEARESVEKYMAMAKRLVLGILVAVAATRMLDEFLQGEGAITRYACGGVLILSVAIFVAIALPERRT